MKTLLSSLKIGLNTAVILFFLLILNVYANAQITRGAISGTVHDEAGAIVAGANVKVTNVGTNATREVTTDENGFYRVGALDPGTYSVMVERSGFSKVENSNIVVSIATEVTFNIEMKVGNISEMVDVTAETEAVSLNKTNATVGTTISGRQAVNLPLGAGRNINNLALLSPNVFSAPGSTGISANGQRARNNNFTIDGSDNNDITVTISTTPVIPEAVGQFQIQTNPYSVDTGRNSGAQINIITRGGTNSFHGDLFEYYRGSRLNALDNIEKRTLTRPARFNRNQFGGAIGGPILKDRLFFFYLFQADRTRTGTALGANTRIPTRAGFARLSTVPLRSGQSAASRQAVLNQLSFLQGIYDQNVQFSSIANILVGNDPNPANRIPIETGIINVGIVQNNNTFHHNIRVDYNLTDKDNLSFRYTSNQPEDTNLISNTQFGSLFSGNQIIFDQNFAASHTHVFGSSLINEARLSYIRRNLDFPENDTTTPTTLIGGLFDPRPGQNFFGGANSFPQSRVTNYYQLADTLSYTVGKHTLKIGGDVRYNVLDNVSGFDVKGTFVFDNLNDYLNNNASRFTQAFSRAVFRAKQWQQFYFAQDDFRIRPNLTLNLGLRYETAGVPFGFFGSNDSQQNATLIPRPVKRDNNNLGPAIGLTYSPKLDGDGFWAKVFGDEQTSIRAGYRINYDLLFFNILTVNAANFPITTSVTQTNVFDVFPTLAPPSTSPIFDPTAGFVNSPEDTKTPYSQIYSLSIQRQFRRDYVFEIGYSGSRSLNQINQLQTNPAILTPEQMATVNRTRNPNSIPTAQQRRLFPTFGPRSLIATTAQSTYNAGYVSLNRSFTNNLQFGVAYTFSKTMSNNDESLGVAAITGGSPQIPQDFFNIRPEKSLSAFDRPHRFVGHFTYEVPLPPGDFFRRPALKTVFGGFEISGIITRQSGQPFTILTGVDSNGNGQAGDRPNVNPDGILTLDPVTGNFRTFTSPLTGGRFVVPLNTNNLPLANSLGNGNLGRNTFRAPGFYNTDLSIRKSFDLPWSEGHRFIIRADFINAFNQDNYGRPINTLSSGSDFGKNLNNWGNRSITLGAKYSF